MSKSIKIVVVGSHGIGKTCFLISFTTKSFPGEYIPTVMDVHTSEMQINDSTVGVELWDTAGAEEYEALRPLSYPQTDVFIVCFSVANRKSFEEVTTRWHPELSWFHNERPHPTRGYGRKGPPKTPPKPRPWVPVILLGLKKDLRDDSDSKHVSKAEGEKLAQDLHWGSYLECSAITSEGVRSVIDQAIKVIIMKPGKALKPDKKKKSLEPLPSIQKGKIEFEFKKGSGLKSADSNGLSDPYVAIRAYGKGDSDDRKCLWKSKVIKKTLDPVWNEKVNVNIDPEKLRGTEGLALQVWDWDMLGGDDFLGEIQFPWSYWSGSNAGSEVGKALKSRTWTEDTVSGTIDFSGNFKS